MKLFRKRRCPSKRIMVRAFLGRLAVKKRFELLDHVFACSRCRAEFLALKEVAAESRAVATVLQGLTADEKIRRRIGALATREVQALRAGRGRGRPAGLRIPRPLGALAGGILLLFSLFIVLKGPRETTLERTGLPWRMELLEPKGEMAATAPAFRWKPLSGVTSYRLEIFDRGLVRVYESSALTEPAHVLPEKSRLLLKPGGLYFWKVVASLDNGQSLESDFGKFVFRHKSKRQNPAP